MKTNYFKKSWHNRKAHVLLVFFLALNFSSLFSQSVLYVDQILYSSTEKSRMAIPSYATQADIHAYDMPLFEQKEVSFRIEKSIDNNGNPETVQTVTNAVNYYEDWQDLSTRKIIHHQKLIT